MGAPWAVSGHIGGLKNPFPGAESVKPVIVNTGGPPLVRKKAPKIILKYSYFCLNMI